MKTVNQTCLPAPTLSRQCCPHRGPTRHRRRKVHHTILLQAILAMTRLLRPNYSLHFRGETGIIRGQIKATACRQKRHLPRARHSRCANKVLRIHRASTGHTPFLPWTHRPLLCPNSLKAPAAELQQRTPPVRARRDRRGPKRRKRLLARVSPGLRKRKRQGKPVV
ncbi:hypothetical protein DFH11DRAFT_1635549 [Phellopilus nigrolimitatus]|nr:hypothetical protein DFH11DRAFT_1635549 [Phellopilus nigrolimitatus]